VIGVQSQNLFFTKKKDLPSLVPFSSAIPQEKIEMQINVDGQMTDVK